VLSSPRKEKDKSRCSDWQRRLAKTACSTFVVQGSLACSRLKSGTQAYAPAPETSTRCRCRSFYWLASLRWRQREVKDRYRSRDMRQGRGRGRRADGAAWMVIVCKRQIACNINLLIPDSALSSPLSYQRSPSHPPSAVPPSTAL
jgi:hypothetical protein